MPARWPLPTDFATACGGSRQTRPVHGECGGYMVLGEGLEDADGVRHAMAGLLGHATSFAKRKLHLGYREARLLADSPLGTAGEIIRGHEFHYATVIAPGTDERFLALTDAQGRASAPPAAGAAASPARSFMPSRAGETIRIGAKAYATPCSDYRWKSFLVM